MMKSLTGLRGLAAIWVLLFHLAELTRNLSKTGVIANGYLGVDLFFALSGFVLCHSNRYENFENFSSFLRFLKRRAVRIYPPHLAALFCTVVAVIYVPNFVNLKGADFYRFDTLLVNALLVQTWTFGLANWNGPSWSLSVELLGYLIFPVAYLLARKLDKKQSIVLALCIFICACIFFNLRGVDNMAKAGYTGVIRMIFSFSLGILSYNIRINSHRTFITLAIVFYVLALSIPTFRPLVLLANPMILVALRSSEENIVSRLLSSNIIYGIGKISFSLYIVQWTALELVIALVPSGGYQVLFCCVSVFLSAAIFYNFIERPSIGLNKRLAAPRSAL